ncbi:MAG: GTP-binding protein [Candidatus Heimdallarchaeota archaeon]|nr:MAG: GTP-binding protein [Candidatus Heimdallarchaeota archaeon]
MSSSDEAAFFKVLIVGDGAVGKTSICTHITTQEFFADYHLTVGCDFFIKRLYVNNISVTLQIFDIGGQDHFARMRSAFADGAKGIFLAFDVTRRDSFYSLENWINSIKDELDPKAPKVLIATKTDLKVEAEVWKDDIDNMEGISIDAYFDTSSLTGDGVPEAFETMARLLLARYKPEEYSKAAQQIKFVEGFYRV